MLKFVLDFVGLKGLLVVNLIVLVVAAAVLALLEPFEKARINENDESVPDNAKDDETSMNAESSMQHPLARLLIVSSFMIIFNKYLVDFLFAASLSSFFSSGNDLASFMGIFGAAADFAVIGLQTFVMNRVFASFPIGRVLAFMPIILVFLCVAASFSLKFAIIAAVQFLVLLNSKNFTVPATTILMGIIPQKNRVFYRRDMSIACSISSAVVGVFLLAARNRIGAELLFILAAAFYLLMAWVHVMLDRAYLKTLKKALDADDASADQVVALRFLQYRDRIPQLQLLLGDQNSLIRIRAIEETSLLPAGMASPLLVARLYLETDSACLTAITRSMLQLAPAESAQHIEKLLEVAEDERLRSDIIETLGKIRSAEISDDLIGGFLDYPHHRVCASAVISCVRLTRNRFLLEKAMKKLARMTVDSRELMRASAAAAMGELGLPLFIPALSTLASENNSMVAGNAAAALARIPNPSAMAALENLLFHDNNEVVQKAEMLLASAARESVARISRLLPGITAEERRKLSAKLRTGRHQDSHDLLAAILCVEDLEKRRALIDILEKADKKTLELMSKCVISLDETRTTTSFACLLQIAGAGLLEELPQWFALLSALGAGAIIEAPAAGMSAVHDLVAGLWHQKAYLIRQNHPELLVKAWEKHAFVCCRLVACLAAEPATMISSMKELKTGRGFNYSMATEYIENQMGLALAAQLIPLLNSAEMPLQYPDFIAFAAARGIDISESEIQHAADFFAHDKG
jgi:HEAT repeat protein